MATLYDVINEGVELGWLGYLALPVPAGVKGPRFECWNEIEIPSTPDEYEALMIDLCSKTGYMRYGCFNPMMFSWDLAVTMNTGVFLLDIDNKPPKTDEDIDEYYRDDNGAIPMGDSLLRYVEERFDVSACPLSRTKSGGYHLYFSGRGVDWTRYNQGARLQGPDGTLLLDCRNPIKGCGMEYPTPGYEWTRPLYRLEELPTVPEALLDWIPPAEEEAAETNVGTCGGGYKTRTFDYSGMKRVEGMDGKAERALLSATLDYIKRYIPMAEGSREHYLNSVAIAAYHRAGLSIEITRFIVEEWAKTAWGMTGERVPWNDVETRIKGVVDYRPKEKAIGSIRRQLGLQ